METGSKVADNGAYLDLYDARLGRTHGASRQQRDLIRDKVSRCPLRGGTLCNAVSPPAGRGAYPHWPGGPAMAVRRQTCWSTVGLPSG
eukprot:6352823-Pyramimonas_sp.AAC.1